MLPEQGACGNGALCVSHVKGQRLPVYKVNRTQKQLPQPSGTTRIFEHIYKGWNEDRHLMQVPYLRTYAAAPLHDTPC